MSKFSLNHVRGILLSAACALLLGTFASLSSAATVGYWRYEDSPGFFQDSSGNARHITGGPLVEATHQVAKPVSGDGSAFPTSIPLTGSPNLYQVNPTAGHYGTVPDNIAFTPSAFTLEGFVNRDTGTAFRMLAAHWGAGTARSWGVGLPDVMNGPNINRLSLFLGNVTGTAFTTFQAPNSSFDLLDNKDYYFAVSWSGSLSGVGNGGIKFYLKNLTDNTPLVTASMDHAITTLHNSNQPITIGANTSGGANPWMGRYDDIRFSNTALGLSELLITAPFVEVAPVPEPSSLLLAAGGMLLIQVRRRKATL